MLDCRYYDLCCFTDDSCNGEPECPKRDHCQFYSPMPDVKALLELEDEMFEDATGLALISQLENNEELQDLQSTMAKALMDYARRIRKALSVPDKRTTDATTC